MKHTKFISRPIDVHAFLDSTLDEDQTTDNANDWREKARELRQRRWRKISEHSKAVSGAIFSSKTYRNMRDSLRNNGLGQNF